MCTRQDDDEQRDDADYNLDVELEDGVGDGVVRGAVKVVMLDAVGRVAELDASGRRDEGGARESLRARYIVTSMTTLQSMQIASACCVFTMPVATHRLPTVVACGRRDRPARGAASRGTAVACA